MLSPVKPVATFDTFCSRRGKQYWDVIAGLGMTGSKDFTSGRFPKHPFQGSVTGTPEVCRHTHPVKMHIDSQGGGRCIVGQPTLLAAHLRKRHSPPAQLGWNRCKQITSESKFLEVFGEKEVLPVIDSGTLCAS